MMSDKVNTANSENVNTTRITLSDASLQLSDLLVKLYKSKTFVRLGKNLADSLFQNGFEGGALVSSIPLLSERSAKLDAANQALLKLNQARYILKAMLSAELYTAAQVNKLLSYLNEVIKGLKQMLDSVPATQRKITVKAPATVYTKPVLKSHAVKKVRPAEKKEPVSATKQQIPAHFDDDDGFNDSIAVSTDGELFIGETNSANAASDL
jgi:hypothetical protein